MNQPQANNPQQQQRQTEWLAGRRRVYPDEVDYGLSGKGQADAGRSRRAQTNDEPGARDSYYRDH